MSLWISDAKLYYFRIFYNITHPNYYMTPPPIFPLPTFYPYTITSPFALPHHKPEPPNFTLPSQTLGFNLNLPSFNNSEPTPLLNNNTFEHPLLLGNNILDSTLLLDNNTSNPTLLLDNNTTLDPTLFA